MRKVSGEAEGWVRDIALGQHGVFSLDQVTCAGMNRWSAQRRVKHGDWVEVMPCEYAMSATPQTPNLRLMAAVLWAGSEAVVSHRSAAALWKLDGFRLEPVELTVRNGIKLPTGSDVVLHRPRGLTADDTCRRDGIPVTRPLRTLFDLASLVTDDALEKCIDQALRQRNIHERLLPLAASRICRKGRPGTVRFKRVLARRKGTLKPTGSGLETRFLVLFKKLDLPEPRRQYAVTLPCGEERFADFAWPECFVWVEIDGYRSHSSRREWANDQTRSNALVALGWRVFRFTAEDLEAPQKLRALLRPLLTAGRSP